jgi:hypothetical protein
MIKINRILTGLVLLLIGFCIYGIFEFGDYHYILTLITNSIVLYTLRIQAAIIKRLK